MVGAYSKVSIEYVELGAHESLQVPFFRGQLLHRPVSCLVRSESKVKPQVAFLEEPHRVTDPTDIDSAHSTVYQ